MTSRCTAAACSVLCLSIVGPASHAVAAPNACEVLPRPSMRVRLVLEPGVPPDLRQVVEETVQRVWRAEGIGIEWLPATVEGDPTTNVWLRITATALRRGLPRQTPVLGLVRFLGGLPHPHVLVSWAATERWVKEERDRRFRGQFAGASHAGLSFAGFDDLARRAVGYAAAHEVGHFVLASQSHDDQGLMRADLVAAAVEGEARLSPVLSPGSRRVLKERLAQGVACPPLRVARR